MLLIVLCLLAALGFVLTVIVNVCSYFPAYAIPMSRAWPLFVGLFPVFFCAIIAQKRWNSGAVPSTASRRSAVRSSADYFTSLPASIHKFLKVCIVCGGLTVVIFFAQSFYFEVSHGNLSVRDGHDVWMKKHKVVRAATAADVRADETRNVRGFSGAWMIFYAVAAAGLYDASVRKREEDVDRAMIPAPPQRALLTGRPPRLSPFAHFICARLASGVCFLGFPVTLVLFVFPLQKGGWTCLFVPIFFGSAIFGAILGQLVFNLKIPARCPACGGRAYASSDGGRRESAYRCRDCGHIEVVKQ